MKNITLGNTQLETAPIVFGGNVFGWTLDKKESFRMLDELLDMGINMIDTADVYSRWADGNKGGESEKIIGEWLKQSGKRDQVIIATKAGMDMGEGKNISHDYILKAAEASLKRLQTDCIDVYFSHTDVPETPIEETLAAHNTLVKEGKVKNIGASNFSAARLKESIELSKANGWPAYEIFQPEYNLYDREDYENNYASLVQEYNLSVVSYFSLASGFLSGKYRSEADLKQSARGELFVKKYLNEKGHSILNALDEVAEAHSTSPAAISLAWLIAQPNVTPIASATKSNHLKAFKDAIEISLTPEEVTKLSNASQNVVL